MRLLDIVAFVVGVGVVVVYWLVDGMWIVNNVLATCVIVAGIKVFKIRALSTGVFMLLTLLMF